MRALVLMLLLVLAFATGTMTVTFLGNRLPWSDPPGRWARLGTYMTTHIAQTTEQSPFPELRPRRYPGVTADRLFAAADHAVADLGWAVLQRAKAERVLRTVVTSPVLRLMYDVEIAATEGRGEALLNARSESRAWQGDLGTNTANLLRLYAAVDAALARPAPAR